MLYLIDGYNLMHAKGPVPPKGGIGLRHARTRLLDALAQKLGPMRAALTTVVFDAPAAPEKEERASVYKGMQVIFSPRGVDADTCIERLIQMHASPSKLTVISSDRRLIAAARRRRAVAISADAFWAVGLSAEPKPPPKRPVDDDDARADLRATTDDYQAFAELDAMLDQRADDAFSSKGFAPTPEQLAQIQREVEAENHSNS
jgi:predicted RNA-binding protein with PIN domain